MNWDILLGGFSLFSVNQIKVGGCLENKRGPRLLELLTTHSSTCRVIKLSSLLPYFKPRSGSTREVADESNNV